METLQLGPMVTDGFYDVAGNGGLYYSNSHASSLWSGARALTSYTSQSSSPPHPRSPVKSRENQESPSPTIVDNPHVDIADPQDMADDEEEEDKDQDDNLHLHSHKQSQVASTLNWLSDNYERAEGVCLPRCVLYTHYLDFCKKMKFTPAGAATFGKIIRQRFPKLTTRRLGTRGQSKYHYYGIGIKESSIYYHSVYSGKGLTRFSGIKIKTEGSNRKYSLSSKTGTLLPEFPEADNLVLSESIERDKLQTFILMYRTHCQRILDTVISANFDEVQSFLLHFWQGMPGHLVDLLEEELITDLVGLCDSILYKVLIDVLIPSTIQDIPDSLCSEIKNFIRKMPVWLENSLENIPDKLKKKKMEVIRGFIKGIRRQISFVHLAQTARSVLQNHDSANQMVEDISAIDFTGICCQAGFTDLANSQKHRDIVLMYFDEFQCLLNKQAQIEAYTEWLDNIIDRCVLQSCTDMEKTFNGRAGEFLLQWAVYSSFIMRDLTLHSASSFGSFHLIHMMFDEYVFLVIETQQSQAKERQLQTAVQDLMKNAEEISMQPKVRTQSGKLQNSPKSRKRKYEDDTCDSNDDTDANQPSKEHRSHGQDGDRFISGTAFSRPVPSGTRENHNFSFHEEPTRCGSIQHNPIPLSPLKHLSTMNNGGYERGSYLPPFSINSYTDFMAQSNTFPSSRVQNLAESHHIHGQGFSSMSISGGPSSGPYWSDSRSHPTFGDPYAAYTYNKFPPSYENYNKASLLRNSNYNEAFNRSAFEASRGYYGRTADSFQVGAPLSVSTYGSNFMDIAPPSGQYGRQDPLFYQEELYPSNIGTISFGKSYIAAPFR